MERYNKFVHFLEVEDQKFIYDISSQTAVALNERLFDLLQEYESKLDKLGRVHPELYNNLLKLGMVVSDDFDEVEKLIEQYNGIDTDKTSFSIILNPTLDCNLRCWYCYESHVRGSMMTPEVMARVKRLIDNKTDEKELKQLMLSFFGGEPLLGWRKVVLPLLEYAVGRCKQRDIRFSTAFTTNGVLLEEEKLEELHKLGLGDTSFQITFDGNRTIHNNSRVGAMKLPTYDKIMRNVRNGAARGFIMNLRFNYTPDNLESFVDVLTDLDKMDDEQKSRISCDFQKVWQSGDEKTRESSLRVADIFNEAGIQASTDVLYHRHHCYADHENQVTINYNGDLYKCTAREFDPMMREGVLTETGDLEMNERYARRMALKYANFACRECEIMPLCNGRCSQGKLEHGNVDSCPLERSAEDKLKIIRGSLIERVYNRQVSMSDL